MDFVGVGPIRALYLAAILNGVAAPPLLLLLLLLGRSDAVLGEHRSGLVSQLLVGGAALTGGEGSTLRSALGAVFISLLANLMLLRDATYGTRILVTGIVVVLATSAFHLLRSRGRR